MNNGFLWGYNQISNLKLNSLPDKLQIVTADAFERAKKQNNCQSGFEFLTNFQEALPRRSQRRGQIFAKISNFCRPIRAQARMVWQFRCQIVARSSVQLVSQVSRLAKYWHPRCQWSICRRSDKLEQKRTRNFSSDFSRSEKWTICSAKRTNWSRKNAHLCRRQSLSFSRENDCGCIEIENSNPRTRVT